LNLKTDTPLDELSFPVRCDYADCGEVLNSAMAVDEHITECHLPESVWTFAHNYMKPVH
jgi:hypothetical protein